MQQGVTAFLAVGVMVGAPVFAGQQIKPDKPALPPHDEALSVQAEGEEGVDEGLQLLIEASGMPAPRTTLPEEQGLETARVHSRTSCAGIPKRSIGYDGPAPEDWCLEVVSLPAHEHVDGVFAAHP
jgi:hypothetical protein